MKRIILKRRNLLLNFHGESAKKSKREECSNSGRQIIKQYPMKRLSGRYGGTSILEES